jgi:uncharacterized protein YjbJ (UPF0337 family)
MDLKAQGQWDKVKGRVKEAWGALTDDDLDRTEGKFDQLVGTIREKTGESVDAVENKLRSLIDRAEEKTR